MPEDISTARRSLSGKAAIVTGGNRGIGLGIAERLLVDGASVVISSTRDGWAEAADHLARMFGPGRVAHIRSDVRERPDNQLLVDDCMARFGRLDIVVANAGIERTRGILEVSDEEWDEVIGVNLRGAFLTTQIGARALVAQGGGRVILVASTNAFWMEQSSTPYNVSKAALIGLMRSAALELAPHHVTVNAVGPGLVATDMTAETVNNADSSAWYLRRIPAGRFGSAADIGGAVAYLASNDAGWVTGHHLVIDGGQTVGMEEMEQPPEPPRG